MPCKVQPTDMHKSNNEVADAVTREAGAPTAVRRVTGAAVAMCAFEMQFEGQDFHILGTSIVDCTLRNLRLSNTHEEIGCH